MTSCPHNDSGECSQCELIRLRAELVEMKNSSEQWAQVALRKTDERDTALTRVKSLEGQLTEMGYLQLRAQNATLRAALELWQKRAPNWTIYQKQMDPGLFRTDVDRCLDLSKDALTYTGSDLLDAVREAVKALAYVADYMDHPQVSVALTRLKTLIGDTP